MSIRTRIILATLAVVAAVTVGSVAYTIDRERRWAVARLLDAIGADIRLVQVVTAGPLYDGNIAQLNAILDSLFANPDILRITLAETRGDIALARNREPATELGEQIERRVRVSRGGDELGTVRVVYTTANIEQRLTQSRNTVVLFSLLLMAALSVVIYMLASRLTRPIERLTRAARAIAAGDLGRDIDTRGAAETAVLGQSFVQMRDAVREKIADLAENNRHLREEIEQRRQAERERDRLASIIEATSDLVSVADPNGKVLYFNRAGRSMLGIGTGNGQPATIPEVHPRWASDLVVAEGVPAAIRDGIWSGETAVLRRDGREIPVSQVILSHKDPEGKLLYLSTIMRDVTERKRAEAALRASEERFAKMFREAPENMTLVGAADGRYLDVNHEFERQTGYARAEAIGRTSLELGLWANPSLREDMFRSLHASGSVHEWEFTLNRRDGTRRDALIDATMVNLGGEPCWLFIMRDITERKLAENALRQSEQRFRALVELSSDWYWTTDEHHRFTFREGEVLRRMGLAPEADYGKTRWEMDFVSPQAEGWDAHRAALERREEFRDLLAARRGGDGELYWATISGRPLFDAKGGFLGYHGTGRDVTAQVRAEQALRRLNAELEEAVKARTAELAAANKELEAFVYSVSHDLRAPLRGIDGFSQVLVAEHGARLDPEARRLLERVRAAAQRMGRLIADLLELSRLTRTEMRTQEVDLSELARGVADELAGEARGRDLRWHIESGMKVRGDRAMLRIALVNLLGNALKYTRDAAPALIALERVERRGQVEEFVVRDNGAGFDMAYAARLFQPFQRLHAQHEFEGTGIGLATVQRVIAKHGGEIRGEGRPGAGAAFYFTLPV
jgi:PAS domain S-box-containing protein